jgi:TonB family protein
MKPSHLALISGFLLFVILAISWYGKKPQTEVTGSPTPARTSSPSASAALSPSPSASAAVAQPSTPPSSKTSSPEFQKVASKVGPAVILVTVFDPSGRLVRTGTGFFISEDGRFVTNSHIVEGGANAVTKSADGKIRNVIGVLTSSDELDLAVLKAETKTGVPFLLLSKVSEQTGTSVAVIGSSLVRREQPLAAATISAQRSDQRADRLETSNPISNDAEGSPVVDVNGVVLGIVTPTREQGAIGTVVRPASTLESLLAQIRPDAKARWAAASSPQPNPSPQPSARAAADNRKSKLTYNPAPKYPPEARLSRISGSGRFRIIFSADGEARDVRVIQSTGKPVLDQAAADSLRQWRSEPGHEWSVVVPITFKP